MNWVDLIIIIVTFSFALEGLGRGFLVQTIDLVGFFISLLASLTFYPAAAERVINLFNLPKIVANPIGFLLVWLIVELLFFWLISPILKRIIPKIHINPLDRFFGFVPAIANSLIILAFILLFVVSLPIRPEIKKDIFNSKTGSILVARASVLERPLDSIFGPIAKQSLTFLTIRPGETQSIPLEFTQSQLETDNAAETKMFELVNQERLKFDVKPLIWQENLAAVGRTHSQDMFERGYFSHYSPEGKDVGDRLTEDGIDYQAAGENLALAPDVSRAHSGLMASVGHRRNILDANFNKIGIGVIDGGVYGKMFTQVFTN